MKRAIVIPTWSGHFEANVRFLRSYRDRVIDAPSAPITFIVSSTEEKESLRSLLEPGTEFPTLRVEIHSVRDVLMRHAVPAERAQAFSVEAFSNIYSYQSIKKIFGVLDSEAEQVLVLDSEAFVYKAVSIQRLFEAYFASPFVLVSTATHEKLQRINRASLSVVDPELSQKEILDSWVFEYPAWFFERTIARAFAARVEARHGRSLFEVLCSTSDVFEVISYYWFIHEHAASYPAYRFLSIPALLSQYLGEREATRFLRHFVGKQHGIMEHFMQGLTRANLRKLQSLVDDLKLDFVRFDAEPTPGRVKLYRRLLAGSQHLGVIACSEKLENLLRPKAFWNELRDFLIEQLRRIKRRIRERLRRLRSSGQFVQPASKQGK